MATLPKSDSTTSLSSLISIGNESKISEIAVRTACIICLGEEGTLFVSKYMRIKIPKDLTIWQKVLLGMAGLAIVEFSVGLVVKLILKV